MHHLPWVHGRVVRLDWSYICPVPFLWQHQDAKIIPPHQPQAPKQGERIGQVKVSFSPNGWKKMGTSRRKLKLQDGLYHLSQIRSFSTGNVGRHLGLDGSEEGTQNADVRQSAPYVFLPKCIKREILQFCSLTGHKNAIYYFIKISHLATISAPCSNDFHRPATADVQNYSLLLLLSKGSTFPQPMMKVRARCFPWHLSTRVPHTGTQVQHFSTHLWSWYSWRSHHPLKENQKKQ